MLYVAAIVRNNRIAVLSDRYTQKTLKEALIPVIEERAGIAMTDEEIKDLFDESFLLLDKIGSREVFSVNNGDTINIIRVA